MFNPLYKTNIDYDNFYLRLINRNVTYQIQI